VAVLFSDLDKITHGNILQLFHDQEITTLLTDSRKVSSAEGSVFFAIGGLHHDGHQYISRLYEQGVRQFIVEKPLEERVSYPEANILLVTSSVLALQQLVAYHRSQISAPIIGITGSNGKTIVKEWLFQLLSPDFKISKNPASYNSQLGVPLSVWQIQNHHTLGIFEAGISTRNEMQNLQMVLQPTIGILTNIGSAHDEGFSSREEKIVEKLKLFKDSQLVIYCKDHAEADRILDKNPVKSLTWGFTKGALIQIQKEKTHYSISYSKRRFLLRIPFTDLASIENCLHCVAALIHFDISAEEIQRRVDTLQAVPMRLELKEGINRCLIIDDTYNNDLAGLAVSLDYLANQNQKKRKRVILSDIHESGLSDSALVKKISALISPTHLTQFMGIGPVLYSFQNDFPAGSLFYRSTEEFLKAFDTSLLQEEVILIKGARVFTFEKIVNHLQRKAHGTVMEIDLGAVVHNLNFFKASLRPSTKIMAMVKAFGYGSGSNEIANVLQYHKTDYLGVAYADEGIELRRNNISLPIMVMNPSEETFDSLLRHNLEPEMYNLKVLGSFVRFIGTGKCAVHIKIDTGMHRLGFEEKHMEDLLCILRKNTNVHVASIFTHLAGADEAGHDQFSREQAKRFVILADRITAILPARPLYHVLNSSGILRLPELQFDMVRLGIGLYGVDPSENPVNGLKPVATLKTIISQTKEITAGETVGYGRKGKAEKDMTIATIAIGYADGFSRAFSNGKGSVIIHGKSAPVIGNVCMDMTMVDITGIAAKEGDEVIIFGKGLPIQRLADTIQTIPYEILTSTSDRVKRVFVAESI
jgi:alanine racemase